MTDDELDRIEMHLGVRLPDEYTKFMRTYTGDMDGLYNTAQGVIDATNELRIQAGADFRWDYDYVVVGDSGCGDHIFIDVSRRTSEIQCLNHENGEVEYLYSSIDRWYKSWMKDL